MPERIRFPCELALLLGLFLAALSVCLFIESGTGCTVISSVPLMLHYMYPVLDFGIWNVIYQIFILFVCVSITHKLKPSYILGLFLSFIFGAFLSFMKTTVAPLPNSLELNMLYLVFAHIVLFFGVSLFMRCYLPLLPTDTLIREIVIVYRISFKKVKTTFDVTCMLTSVVLGILFLGGVVDIGIGTVTSAFITGYFVARITTRLYDKWFDFVPSTRLSQMLLSEDSPHYGKHKGRNRKDTEQ